MGPEGENLFLMVTQQIVALSPSLTFLVPLLSKGPNTQLGANCHHSVKNSWRNGFSSNALPVPSA